MIGSLSHLIRSAAIEAILDGTEKITLRDPRPGRPRPRRSNGKLRRPASANQHQHMSTADSGLPRPLPIRPRSVAGESPVSYIRRLANANHLRPGYLFRGQLGDAS